MQKAQGSAGVRARGRPALQATQGGVEAAAWPQASSFPLWVSVTPSSWSEAGDVPETRAQAWGNPSPQFCPEEDCPEQAV